MHVRDVSLSSARREVLSKASIAIGGSLLFVAGFTVATARGVLDPGQFAGRLAASLDDERVARYVGDRLTDAVVAQKPDLIAVRPVIHSTMTAVVQSEPFRGVVRTAARSTHRAILDHVLADPRAQRVRDLAVHRPIVLDRHLL